MHTRRRKALTIGINYFGQAGKELRGCVNDSNKIKNFLICHFGYKDEDIVQLIDEPEYPRPKPTKAAMIEAMQWLVEGAKPGDSLFFHYSGHGGQTEDLDGDEADGLDEVIYPVDHELNGHIVDDDMHTIMVRPLPLGCRLTAIFDSCNSGTALDLPYVYSREGEIEGPIKFDEALIGPLVANIWRPQEDRGRISNYFSTLLSSLTRPGKRAQEHYRQTHSSSADVISWSACKDYQSAADNFADQAMGAITYAFMEALGRQHEQSYHELFKNILEILNGKCQQQPQLSSSHVMDTKMLFIA